jgi:hypothetical protein
MLRVIFVAVIALAIMSGGMPTFSKLKAHAHATSQMAVSYGSGQ